MNDTSARIERIRGALLGVHAGDALGATLEFSSPQEIRTRYPDGLREIIGGGPFAWPAGHATDDTDLTRAVLLAYLEPGDDVVRTAADHMMAWQSGNWPDRSPGSHPVDIGGATRTGLDRYADTGDPRRSGSGIGSAGNGSLMRAIPTALAVASSDQRIRDSAEISAITHNDPRCTVSCAAYNEIAATLVDGGQPADAVAIGVSVAQDLGKPDVAAAVTYGRALSLVEAATTGETLLANDGRGFVLDSLSIAVAAVLDDRPLVDVLVDVVRIGYDTDTNAAIAGGLLGARDGASAIPATWVSALQFADEFLAAAAVLAAR